MNSMRQSTYSPLGRFALAMAVLGLLEVAGHDRPVMAQDDPAGANYARVRYIVGGLTTQSSVEQEITEAAINSPVAPGDRLWTDSGRAEIQLADSSVVWMDQGTRLSVRSLSDIDNPNEPATLLALEQGSLRIEVRESPSSEHVFQIDAGAGSIYLLSAGSFRIDSDSGVTTVSSIRGVAELSGDTGSVLVRSGERSSARSRRSPADPRRFNTLRADDFDQFCQDRSDAYFRRAEERDPYGEIEREVPQEVHPYLGELAAYGAWHSVPTYGWVWRPAYVGSWGPYVTGHWTWCPAGWVWVSEDVWGWAPYHYGRWDLVSNIGWVWIPGARWRGAWVSFAVGPSYVGWSPLNYYDRPVFQSGNVIRLTTINVTRLDPRGWRFAPVDQFSRRGMSRHLVRGDRLPRGTEVVLTQRLPQFDPRAIAARPEQGRRLVEKVRGARESLPDPNVRPGEPVSFRVRERGSSRGGAPRSTPGRSTDPVVRPEDKMNRTPGPAPRGRPDVRRFPVGPGFGTPGTAAPRPAPSRAPQQLPGSSAIPPGPPSGSRPQTGPSRPAGSDNRGETGSGTEVRGQARGKERRFAPAAPGNAPAAPAGETDRSGPAGPSREDSPPNRSPAERLRGHAVERLFEGARRSGSGVGKEPAPPERSRSGQPGKSRPGSGEKPKEKPRRGEGKR